MSDARVHPALPRSPCLPGRAHPGRGRGLHHHRRGGIHDALYISVVTITAVGYSKVLPLSELGRDFTMAPPCGRNHRRGYLVALITSFIVECDLSDVRKRHQIMRSIEALNDHIVLCGGGRTGRQVMEELLSLGQEFVVIERDSKRVEWIHEQLIVIAVRKQTDQTHQFVFNPVAATRLEPGDEMIVLGQPKQVDLLRKYAQA